MGWKTVKLSHVLKQYRIEHWVQDNANYKQVSILNDGSVVLRGEKNGKEIGRKRQFIIDLDKYPNTLIFTRQLLLQGSIGIADKAVDKCIVTENMPMFSVNDNILLDYLFVYLKSEVFKTQVGNTQTSGTAQKSIHERQFLEYEIPLPTINEQKVFVKKFKATDNYKILESELQHQSDLIKKLRQSILQDAVQGKLSLQAESRSEGRKAKEEDAHQLLQKIKAEKQKLIAAGKLKIEKELTPISPDEIPFELPKGWAWCRFGDVGILKRGKSKHRPRNDNKLYQNGNYPLIQTGEVSRAKYNNGLIKDINSYYNDFGLAQSELQKVGTLCITIAANIAEYGFLQFEACVPDSIVCFNSIDNSILKYVSYFINISKDDLERYAPSTAQKNINLGILTELMFPLPPLSEQKRIVAKVEELMQTCDALEKEVEQSKIQLQHLMQSVLREAFEGK